METAAVIDRLKQMGDASKVAFKEQKFNIVSEKSLGIYMADLRLLAKELPKDAILAMELFDTEIYEARLLCSKIFPVKETTNELTEKWVKVFHNWENLRLVLHGNCSQKSIS